MRNLIKLLIFSIIVLLGHSSFDKMNSSDKFIISIERQIASANCIMGYLSINNRPICYTMELPYRGNIKDLSSIPNGTYDAFIRTDKEVGWRIELVNVPYRRSIQIHIGNYTSDITGCTLVGKTVDIDNCNVWQSKNAITEIESKLVNFQSDLCLNCNSSQEYQIEVEYK